MCEHVYVALKMAGGFLLKARLLYFNTLVYSAEDSKVVFFYLCVCILHTNEDRLWKN